MARKKTSSSRKRTTRKSTARKSSSGKSATRKNSARKPAGKPTASRKPRKSTLSLDRKLDITGVIMAVIGLLSLFGMLSTTKGVWMGRWLGFLLDLFGWGGYVLPIGVFLVGLWLIMRNFERLPQFSLERAVGIFLLFACLLTGLQFLVILINKSGFFVLPTEGSGGGYVGGIFFNLLENWLGLGGTAVILLAWFILAMVITFDMTVWELFRWVTPLGASLRSSLNMFTQGGRSLSQKLPRSPRQETPDSVARGEATPQLAATPQDSSVVPALDEEVILAHEWVLPAIDFTLDASSEVPVNDEFDRQRAQIIEESLESFGAPGRVVEINRGPTITQFGVEPDFIESRAGRKRVRVNKIAALADDLALALAATRVRVEAPVPGKGFVGIEVPNAQVALVSLRDGITNEAFRRLEGRPLRFALGQDVSGNAVAADLAAMPHLLIAGTTGSGKSVCVNSIIASFLMHNTPDELRLIMVDPKRVELTGYDGIPHLLAPVVVELERVVGALQWVTREMDQRYEKFADLGARNLVDYNTRAEAQGLRKLPYLVVIIDELADLMMLAPDETERTITRMAQLARATGIHMVISTQRPSVDVVTGLIKANFPARIAFATASGTDSRVILDQPGAERLLGRGDMLFQAPDAPAPVRLQGVFVSDFEILRIVQYWRDQHGYVPPTSVTTAAGGHPDGVSRNIPLKQMEFWDKEDLKPEEDRDPLYDEAVDMVRRKGRASISMLQRGLRIGYTRAARLIDVMEQHGIIGGPTDGPIPRDVLDYGPAAPPVDED
ncbi:MAG: DNA translocase FtsK 4TM domain-containing protein [Anaerolineales bacterium]|nr:DNA translocase FtsK 4TM domain-containing protein [Anaerolineales bacterium]